jgi:hypothetical protein
MLPFSGSVIGAAAVSHSAAFLASQQSIQLREPSGQMASARKVYLFTKLARPSILCCS